MFMLKSTHERILAEKVNEVQKNWANRYHEFLDMNDKYEADARKYRAQRDAANKHKRDARKAAKVAK